MKKILVTGGAGYIGSHTVKELIKEGFSVVVYDNLFNGQKEAVLKPAELVVGDLLDSGKLNSLFKKHHFDGVFHFAALIEAGESEKNPIAFFKNNVIGSLNLLEAVIQNKIKLFVYSSTAAVYGEPSKMPIKEDADLKPINCYGETKKIIEEMLKCLDRTKGLKYISLRYFNAAGADPEGELGENHNPETHLIPKVLHAVLKNEPVYIYGQNYNTPNGTCIRDFVHVTDLAKAHVLAFQYLQSKNKSDIFNLGSEKGNSVLEVIEKAKKITESNFKIISSKIRPGDPARLVASAKKAKKILGWQPKYDSLDIIIKTAWDWHRNKFSKRNNA